MKPKVSDQIFITPGILHQDLLQETVLLDLNSESYFGLQGVGSRIWSLLKENNRLERIYEILLMEYDVEPSELERDLVEHIEALLDAGLVTIDSHNNESSN